MKTFPLTVIDDFFKDPDYIRNLGLSVDYPTQSGRWPGRRSELISYIDSVLFHYIGNKIFSIFGTPPENWNMEIEFQKITPFSNDKWDIVNRGYVHRDRDAHFGGVIYLNKNPDVDTGTSVYKPKTGYNHLNHYQTDIKAKLYNNQDFDMDEYIKQYNVYHDRFVETIKIDNVYNRLVLFGGDTYHGVRTFGTEERLTISFFCQNASNYFNPLVRL